MRWTAAADRRLLLIAFERTIATSEYAVIATLFAEDPTASEVQARLVHLRHAQMTELQNLGLGAPESRIQAHEEGDAGTAAAHGESNAVAAEENDEGEGDGEIAPVIDGEGGNEENGREGM